MRLEDRKRVRAWAGASRLVFGSLAVFVFPAIHPGLERAQPVFALYCAIALLFQVLIFMDIGDRPRAISGNVVDTLAITYMVQQIGSTTTAFAALYVFAAVVNTLAVGRRVGITAAIVASIAYGAVLACEVLGLIPYAPAARASATAPPMLEAVAVWFVMTLQLVLSAQIVGALVGFIKDRELALREANEKLEKLSRRDPLTDLWNRRHLMDCLTVSLAAGGDLSVVMIDLDGFKRVNDTLGHAKGDGLLRALARAIETDAARGGTVFRVGGDEFLIMLAVDAARAVEYGERVVTCVRETRARAREARHVRASVREALFERRTRAARRAGRTHGRDADHRARAAVLARVAVEVTVARLVFAVGAAHRMGRAHERRLTVERGALVVYACGYVADRLAVPAGRARRVAGGRARRDSGRDRACFTAGAGHARAIGDALTDVLDDVASLRDTARDTVAAPHALGTAPRDDTRLAGLAGERARGRAVGARVAAIEHVGVVEVAITRSVRAPSAVARRAEETDEGSEK